MTAAITRDDLLDAYLRGKAAGRTEDIYDQDADEELTFEAVLHRFNEDGPSDVLALGERKPAELVRLFLDCADTGQFVYRTTHDAGWMMQVLTTHGSVVVNQDTKGNIKFHVPSPPLGSGSLDMRTQILRVQAQHREEGRGWNLETGAQFGRWF